ncbi:hypothetical protein C1645_734758 [Glomus cerebriforme]|uniref:Uncharacterized protein n=1 Tax=Glomus cerebriforme TaxID=658196 RepID=A0A397THK4_9GLOM|nr:hypothetical protein C1645_734758 [Glomus cerebriforme]
MPQSIEIKWIARRFSELFVPDWEGKRFSILSVRYWNQKRFLDFISGLGFFQFWLRNLISFEVKTSKLSFQNVCSWTWETEIFGSGNSESEKKYLALEMETKT